MMVRVRGRWAQGAATAALALAVAGGETATATLRTSRVGVERTTVLVRGPVAPLDADGAGRLAWALDGSSAVTWSHGGVVRMSVRPAGGRFSPGRVVEAGRAPGATVREPVVGPGGATFVRTDLPSPTGTQLDERATATLGRPDGTLGAPQDLGLSVSDALFLAEPFAGGETLVATVGAAGLAIRTAAAGAPLGAPVVVADPAHVRLGEVRRAAVDPRTGAVLLAWIATRPCAAAPRQGCDTVEAVFRAASGRPFGPPIVLDEDAGPSGTAAGLAVMRVADRFVTSWHHADAAGVDELRVSVGRDGPGAGRGVPGTAAFRTVAGCATSGATQPQAQPSAPAPVAGTLAPGGAVRLVLARPVDVCRSTTEETVVPAAGTPSAPVPSRIGAIRNRSGTATDIDTLRDSGDGEILLRTTDVPRLARAVAGGPFGPPRPFAPSHGAFAGIAPVGRDDVALVTTRCGTKLRRTDALVLRAGRAVRRVRVLGCGEAGEALIADGGRIVLVDAGDDGLSATVTCSVTARSLRRVSRCAG